MKRYSVIACMVILAVQGMCARGWRSCNQSCAKTPAQPGRYYDVVPLGYPYGFDRIPGGMYLAPYGKGARYGHGIYPTTFGYLAVDGVAADNVRRPCQACKECDVQEPVESKRQRKRISTCKS